MATTLILAFTDECGVYEKERSDKFLLSNPFYVRSNLFIDVSDYIALEKDINEIKGKYGISDRIEVKWAHYGSRLKNKKGIPHDLSVEQMQRYFTEILEALSNYETVHVYYTFTDNNEVPKIDATNLLKMHLQNVCQRLQKDSKGVNGYGMIIADELNDKTKILKKAVYELISDGDVFTDFTHLHKGFFVDQSDLSVGLQSADILAGVFTATLKCLIADQGDKHKFSFAYNLYTEYVKNIIRYKGTTDKREIYLSGIKEIPSSYGKQLAEKACEIITKRQIQQ